MWYCPPRLASLPVPELSELHEIDHCAPLHSAYNALKLFGRALQSRIAFLNSLLEALYGTGAFKGIGLASTEIQEVYAEH
jgi:hypothetical protein